MVEPSKIFDVVARIVGKLYNGPIRKADENQAISVMHIIPHYPSEPNISCGNNMILL